MFMTRARSLLSVALVSAASTLGGTAQAAFYTGTWDPAYGGADGSIYDWMLSFTKP